MLCRHVQALEGRVEGSDSVAAFISSLQTLPQALQQLPTEALSRRGGGRIEGISRQNTSGSKATGLSRQAVRHLWVRAALLEKVLDKIVQHLAENSSLYYEKYALLMDPVDGRILASLLVGPCALEYTQMKTADHYWTDPSAEELMQRHRIHSPHYRTDASPSKKPALHIRLRQASSGSVSEDRPAPAARDHVELLHQSSRSTLIYGKNSVRVQPRGDLDPVPGYLSLHQSGERLTLKWTPNQLMNGSLVEPAPGKGALWDYTVTVHLEHIVYIHCHQQCSESVLVLVGQDGVQRPPVHFPPGGHLLSFLTCLESGLAPNGCLDPPLDPHSDKGGTFQRSRKRLVRMPAAIDQPDQPELGTTRAAMMTTTTEKMDFVFRIIYPNQRSTNVIIIHHYGTTSRAGSGSMSSGDEEQERVAKEAFWEARQGVRRYAGHPAAPLAHALQGGFLLTAFIPPLFWPPPPTNQVPSLCKYLLAVTSFCVIPIHSAHSTTFPERLTNLLDYTYFTPFILHSHHQQLASIESFTGQTCCLVQLSLAEYVPKAAIFDHDYSLAKAKLNLVGYSNDRVLMPLKSLCENMQKQILSRALFGWLAYCKHMTTVRTHLSALVQPCPLSPNPGDSEGITGDAWESWKAGFLNLSESELFQRVYYGGVEQCVRRYVWPYLLRHYRFGMSCGERDTVDVETRERYQALLAEWHTCKAAVRQRGTKNDNGHAGNSSLGSLGQKQSTLNSSVSSEVFESTEDPEPTSASMDLGSGSRQVSLENPEAERVPVNVDAIHANVQVEVVDEYNQHGVGGVELQTSQEVPMETPQPLAAFSDEELDNYAINLQRIDKDVHRCDRSYWYFTADNLEKLREIMCCYVWEHLDVGYVQGMCDLLAPLLVILDDEVMSFSCFSLLMKQMSQNFPHGGAMDTHFSNMRSLIQVLDIELFEWMQRNGDFPDFFFCYRWFLLNFKRELLYDDVFTVWEVIWAARYVASAHFILFLALALVTRYRDVLLENNMDFTDIIRFFNEMAERHDVQEMLATARNLVFCVQSLIENK
uniref:small G protein signaling modulator 2-like n=1 Tax=Myxine glutinosa TaxID=7769 RepID=UPI00358E0C67